LDRAFTIDVQGLPRVALYARVAGWPGCCFHAAGIHIPEEGVEGPAGWLSAQIAARRGTDFTQVAIDQFGRTWRVKPVARPLERTWSCGATTTPPVAASFLGPRLSSGLTRFVPLLPAAA
jgi:hypothetical protein